MLRLVLKYARIKTAFWDKSLHNIFLRNTAKPTRAGKNVYSADKEIKTAAKQIGFESIRRNEKNTL